jgi:hypothetical protein
LLRVQGVSVKRPSDRSRAAELDVNTAAIRKLTVAVGDRNKPTAGGKGVIYLDDLGVGHPLPTQ